MVTELKPIPNSSVHEAGYDAATQLFAVRYKEGGPLYVYKDVPPDLAQEFEAAESKGRFIAKNIRGAFDLAADEQPEGDA
jgi:hypothetical protein